MTTGMLLEIRGLTVRYQRGRGRPPLTALHGVDLGVAAGETLSVVGESGSGKSTLGNAVLGLVASAAGTIRFAGEDLTHANPRRRRALTQDIQVVFQDPHGSLNPVRTIGQTLEEPLLAHRTLRRPQRRAQVAGALERVGLDAEAAARYPAQFSGGQLQRIAIARALMLSPRLIICDEAVSALDLSIQAQILNLLHDLQQELRLSYLFISHDLAVVRHVSDRVAVLYRGRLMETGTAQEVCERPRHPYTQALLAAAPVPDPAEQRRRRRQLSSPPPPDPETSADLGCPFRTRCPHAAGGCADPLPVHAAGGGVVTCHRYPELRAGRLRDLTRQDGASPSAASGSSAAADHLGKLDGHLRSLATRSTTTRER
jgi:oligopeptide/dipeptide ABC transporter ATP-binding protein